MTRDEVRAQLDAERKKTADLALTEDEEGIAADLAAIEHEREEQAARAAKKRAPLMLARQAEGEKAVPGGVPVKAVDLVALFPLGSAPPLDTFPSGGVVALRAPTRDASEELAREQEANKAGVAAMIVKFVAAALVAPDPESPEGTRFLVFLESYTEAAGTLAAQVKRLGGAKATADKRGRA